MDGKVKLIIAGSRDITDYNLLLEAFTFWPLHDIVTEIVSGTARGVDRLGERYAKENGITLSKFPADWNSMGKKAGIIRNHKMGDYADQLLCLWSGSNGSRDMIKYMKSLGKPVYVCIIQNNQITGNRCYNVKSN